MADHLKALVVVLILTTTVFTFARSSACALAMSRKDFGRRCYLWLGITLAAFLAHNFWIFIIATGILLFFAARRESNKFAIFLGLLLAMAPMEADIRGVGGIKTLFTIDYYRLLSLAVLAPAYLSLRRLPDTERFGRSLPDKLLLVHLVLFFLLKMNAGSVSITETVRQAVFYPFVEIFLPYYVASRALKTLQDFRSALMWFVVGALVLGMLGAFESAKGWLLYGGLDSALGTKKSLTFNIREGAVRAVATCGGTIPYGYVMATAAGLFLYVGRIGVSPTARLLGWLVLLGGLVASLSRGPWVGAVVMLVMFLLTGPSALAATAKLAVLGLLGLPLLALPIKEKIILDYLPFVGTIQSENVIYRLQLLKAGIEVIARWPWFGNFAAFDTPEMQAMKQGQGIIDVVNTYLQVTLERGLVGLFVFVAFFAAVAAGIVRGMNTLPDKHDERHTLGQALIATLLGILAIITTVSSIQMIPWIYWSVAGIGVAYARMAMLPRTAGPAELQPAAAIR